MATVLTEKNIVDTAKTKEEITDKSNIRKPRAGFVRLITTMLKGENTVYNITDLPLKVKGKDNPVIPRYIRKWEAAKREYAINNIDEIIYPPDYTPPTFSEEMLRTGSEKEMPPEIRVLEELVNKLNGSREPEKPKAPKEPKEPKE